MSYTTDIVHAHAINAFEKKLQIYTKICSNNAQKSGLIDASCVFKSKRDFVRLALKSA
jgi:hypothetical protein